MSKSDDGDRFLVPRTYEQLRVTSAPRLVQVVSGPHVVPTRRGYQPALCVEELHEGKHYLLYISAASLTDALESIRSGRGGSLVGAAFTIRKAGEDKMSPYEVELA